MLELNEAKEMVRGILESNPGYTAPNMDACRYFKGNGHPDCVIGHVFRKIGIRYAEVFGSANTTRVDMLEVVWHGKISGEAADFLNRVQIEQDKLTPWGEILPRLDELMLAAV